MADNSGIVWDDENPKQKPAPAEEIIWDDEKPKQRALPKSMTAGQVAIGAAVNAIPSTVRLVGDIAHTVMHPIDTAKSLGELGSSVLGAAGITDADPRMAHAVGQYFMDRYGGVENIKRSFAEDPAGILADLSSLAGGTGLALKAGKFGKLAEAAGKASEVAAKVSRATDPLAIVGKGLTLFPKAGSAALGFRTGVGSDAINEAARTGYVGGNDGRKFREQIRGGDLRNVVKATEPALENMFAKRAADYRAGMAGVGEDIVPVTGDKLQGIYDALQKVEDTGKYKDKVINRPAAEATLNIKNVVDDWMSSDPWQYHTPEGLDKLKQNIWNESKGYAHGTPSRVYADKAYDSVKGAIIDAAPEYANVMKDYQDATDILREMESSLSLKKSASADTKIRKLQSIMRNNANTNYGRRAELGKVLADNGATDLFPILAGQALNSWTPRGLSGNLSTATVLGGYAPTIVQGLMDPTFYAQMALSSPRLVGEAVHAGGRAASVVKPVVPVAKKLANQKARAIIYQLRQRELPQEDDRED